MPEGSAITERDRQIMAALNDPNGAEAAGVDPFEYADWIERPEIKRALEARDDLHARHDQAIARQFRDELIADTRLALAKLKAAISEAESLAQTAAQQQAAPRGTPPSDSGQRTQDSGPRIAEGESPRRPQDSGPHSTTRPLDHSTTSPPPDPSTTPPPHHSSTRFRALSESRRAASSILRLATRYLHPWHSMPRPRHSALGTQHSTSGIRRSVPHGRAESATQHAERGTQHDPDPRSESRRGDTQDSAPLPDPHPEVFGSPSPEEAVANLLLVLRHLADPTPFEAFAALDGGLSMDNRCYADNSNAFMTGLWYSPAMTHRDRPWRTEPAIIDGDNARQRILFTNPDNTETPCTIHLVKNQRHCSKDFWYVEAVIAESGDAPPAPPNDTS